MELTGEERIRIRNILRAPRVATWEQKQKETGNRHLPEYSFCQGSCMGSCQVVCQVTAGGLPPVEDRHSDPDYDYSEYYYDHSDYDDYGEYVGGCHSLCSSTCSSLCSDSCSTRCGSACEFCCESACGATCNENPNRACERHNT